MTIANGLSEQIELVDQNGDNIEDLFGAFTSASFIIDETNRTEYSIGNNGKAADISDGPVENRASITCKPETLEILKVMGTFDSGAGTITFDKFLPKLNVLNGQTTDSLRFHFEDLKFGGFNLGAEIDAEPFKKVLDDSSFPLTVQDVRSEIGEISFDFGDGNGELVIENGKAEINTYDFDEDKDTRTVELSFDARDIKVRNL